ncbi:MAG: DUF1330 domain-containing protein [Pseudomonadota bacterium]
MSAYLIGHITVKNVDKWAEYRRQVPATLDPWGGRLVFRGQLVTVLAGEHNHTDTVVIQFGDQKALCGWYDSPAYKGLIPLRTEAADIVLISYDE